MFLFDLKVAGSLVQQDLVPKLEEAPSGVWNGSFQFSM